MNLLAKERNERLLDAITLIVLGLIMVLFPNFTTQVFVIVTGVLALVFACLFLFAYFATFLIHDPYLLLRGLLLLIVGTWILSDPGSYLLVMVFCISIYLIYMGIQEIAYAVDLHKMKVKGWWIDLIFGILSLGMGVSTLVIEFMGGRGDALVAIFAGSSLILEGVMELVLVYALHRDFKRASKIVSEQ
jgi:uncharacterized membrane protein HdeD (DUF308 family)